MGIVLAFLSAFSYAVANLFGKKAATGNLVPGFALQYGIVTAFSTIMWTFSGETLPNASFRTFAFAAVLGISGYAGIYAYLASSRLMPMGTFLAMAYGYVVALYFINAAMFPDMERLSWQKYAFAAAFFAAVCAFLVHSGKKGAAFLKYAWMPAVSLVAWVAYFGSANYVVKSGIAGPISSLVLAEGSIFLAALAVFAFRKIEKPATGEFSAFHRSHAVYGIAMAAFLAAGTALMFLSYARVAANLTNTIGLSTTVITATLFALVFGERLPKSDWALIIVSTSLLAGFLIVP